MDPLPAAIESPANPITEAKLTLGRMLFYDPRLSLNRDVSCNSCHDLGRYGVDGAKTSTGHRGQKGGRNSPTVYNAAGHLAQFWDGRAADVEEQAKGPVLNPIEMAMPSAEAVEERLRSIAGYREPFQRAFPGGGRDPVTFDNMARAIAAFERKLVTPSRWDRYLGGERDALTPAEVEGYREFERVGCITCHNGPYVGGRLFHRLGSGKAWPSAADPGRFAVTGQVSHKMVFKVPSLRNIAKTGPYLHDGSVDSLNEAVMLMAEYQLRTYLDDGQARKIVTWLNCLTGELPTEFARPPRLPE